MQFDRGPRAKSLLYSKERVRREQLVSARLLTTSHVYSTRYIVDVIYVFRAPEIKIGFENVWIDIQRYARDGHDDM